MNIPDDLHCIVKKMRMRLLIRLGTFEEVASAGQCNGGERNDNDDDDDYPLTTAEAYGLHRSGDYVACRKLCTGIRVGGGGKGGDAMPGDWRCTGLG